MVGKQWLITGPPNGPVLFCLLASVVVCNAAGRLAGRRVGSQAANTPWRASTLTSCWGDTLFFTPLQPNIVANTLCF